LSDLWAIACHFNPVGYRRRVQNFRAFREKLEVPLVAVELVYGEKPELSEADADILIQLRAKDVLWQKERLLNLALAAVPAACKKIAWLDADVIFERDDWAPETARALDHAYLVQPFRGVIDLDEAASTTEIDFDRPSRYSASSRIATGELPVELIATEPRMRKRGAALGLAWAGRRELFSERGFYDASILGGGDRVIMCAGYGLWRELMPMAKLSAAQCRHLERWALPFYEAVKSRIGFVEGAVATLWHGDLKNRGHQAKRAAFEAFDFDPEVDIAIDPSGAWRWASPKLEMHDFVASYFASRNEDGNP